MDRARLILMVAALVAAPAARGADALSLDLVRDSADGRSVAFAIDHQGEALGWRFDVAHSAADGGSEGVFQADDLALGLRHEWRDWSFGFDAAFWMDSSDTDSLLYTASGAWQGEAWRFGLEASAGSISTSLPSAASADLARRDYDRDGLRASAEWRIDDDWRVWAGTSSWSYDPALDADSDQLIEELVALTDLRTMYLLIAGGNAAVVDAYLVANGFTELRQVLADRGLNGLARVIRFQQRRVNRALSLQTFALGLSDPTFDLGIERRVGAGRLTLSYQQLEIPVDDLSARSLQLELSWPMNDHLDLAISGGAVRTEDYGTSYSIGLRFQYFLD